MSSSDSEKEKKPTIPTKSSMEILSELFSTFHAEPPLIIKKEKSDESGKKHKKKKKHKHKDKKHKKKDKRKKRSSSSSSDKNAEVDLAKILIRQTKAEQKIKIEGTCVEVDLNNIRKEVKKEEQNSSSNKVKIKDDKVKYYNSDFRAEKKDTNAVSDSKKKIENTSNGKKKIVIKDLKSSSVSEVLKEKEREQSEGEIIDSDDDKRKKHKSKHKRKHDKDSRKRSRSRSRERSDKKSKLECSYSKSYSSWEKSKDQDRQKDKHHSHTGNDFYKGHSSRSKDDEWTRDRYRDKSRDRYKDEYDKELEEYTRSRNRDSVKDDGFYKSRERNDRDNKWTSSRDRYREREYDRDRNRRSNSKDRESSSRIDKKKLLEIARRNAINMMKSGSLPAALSLGPQAQEKVIAAIKSGGKTIEELTDFCKTLSKKEELGELSSLSEKDDSDSDNDKAFHHPFLIKDRPTSITMNIKNSVPLPIKTLVERSSELRMQFPVSSGQQHRKGEDWMPVSPPPAKKMEEKPAAPLQPAASIIPADVPLPPLPIEAPPPPLPAVVPPVAKAVAMAAKPVVVPVAMVAPVTLPAQPVVPPPGPQAYPSAVVSEQAVDISSIVSQRLTAMRKLQENPHDVQALTQMHKSNREMQSWASSKQQFGQFTGSTGANILSQAELSSGFQAWAKKDQLQTAAPVTGGMGMHLLQKMGWKPGEGLGKEKTGTLEPLLLDVKLDKRGLVSSDEQPHKKKQKLKGQPAVKTLQGKHPVSLLGEYASKRKLGAPQYVLDFECGPDHKKNFLFKVVLNGVEYKPNVASQNKKEAKAAAATLCLQQIGLLPTESST